ncbi:MAG: thymidine kinase [Roseburia sp.]|nr:thymidine kinase [Roseburia sp.]
MAKLYFRYGAMGSSKSANALMVEYNYRERGKHALLAKPCADKRDGERVIKSRIGLQHSCIWTEELVELSDEEVQQYDCIIIDEAQFCTKEQIEYFVHLVDELNIPVICYGLRADFQNNLFPGSLWLLAWADVIEEVKTVCWCGRAARCNARFNEHGIIREGAQVVLGGNDSYVAVCRKHLREGNLGPDFRFEQDAEEKDSVK